MSNLTTIMSLNEDGLNAFRELIKNRRQGIVSSIREIAFDKKFINQTSFKTEISLDKKFTDRYDIAVYLNRVMHYDYSDNKDSYDQDIGLWSWLALVYFDQICGDTIRAEANYIYNTHSQRSYRHCIFGPYYLFDRYGEYSRLHISGNIDEMGNGIEQAISRDYLMSNRVARELMTLIYADPNNKGIARKNSLSQIATKEKQILKNGKASSQGFGGIARFSRVFQKIRLTCYVHNISSEMLLELMGDEFKQWVE